jgi:hypothetical protein
LHYTIEVFSFFKLAQQVSILGEAFTGIFLMVWAKKEYSSSEGKNTSNNSVSSEYVDNGLESSERLLREEEDEDEPILISNAKPVRRRSRGNSSS